MNHDYEHCADFTKDCPKKCFRAQLERDLEKNPQPRVSYINFEGTKQCKRRAADSGQND